MDTNTAATLIQEGGRLITDGIKLLLARPRKRESEESQAVLPSQTPPPPPQAVKRSLPTSAETTHELKRRLAKELYKAELDLAGGLKIAGRSCDCLTEKHGLMLEAAAEELVSQDPDNHVYLDIIKWINDNQSKVTPEAIDSEKYAEEYPRMAAQFKEFRKRVAGTTATVVLTQPVPERAHKTMTLEEAKKIAATQAEQEVERRWQLAEKK